MQSKIDLKFNYSRFWSVIVNRFANIKMLNSQSDESGSVIQQASRVCACEIAHGVIWTLMVILRWGCVLDNASDANLVTLCNWQSSPSIYRAKIDLVCEC